MTSPAGRVRTVRLAALALGVVLAAGGAMAPVVAAADPGAVAPGRVSAAIAASRQVLVTWSADDLGRTRAQRRVALDDDERLDRLTRAAGMRAAFSRQFGTDATSAVYRFVRALGTDADGLLARLRAVRGVVAVEADPVASIDAPPVTLPDDPFATQQWNMLGPGDASPYGVDVLHAWPTARGGGAVVAVLDTGIRTHADLAGQTVPGYDLVTDAWTANDGDGRDGDPADPGDFVAADQAAGHCSQRAASWHGTHVTGIIAAIDDNALGVFGAAPDAKVQAVRVLGRCGGSFADIADGITWASGGTVAGVPANATPSDVLNLSLGARVACPQFMADAIAGAIARGTLVVASAGNSGLDASGQAPANCPGVVSVAATDSTGFRADFGSSGSSNYGATVTIAAPGKTIVSTWNNGTYAIGGETFGTGSGTSQAAPHVAAVAALLRSSRPEAQPAALRRAMVSSVTAFAADATALGCPTVGCGAGIVDAPAALAFLATADIAGPVATVTRPAPATAAASVAFAVTFDEPAEGLAATDLATDGTAGGCVVGTPTGAGTTWSVPVTGCADGTVALALAPRAVADGVGNLGPDDQAVSDVVLIDRTAPVSAASVTVAATNASQISVDYTASDGAGAGVASVQAFVSSSATLASPQACGAVTSSNPSGSITCTLPAADATYRVFTRATDALGSVEPPPATADDAVIRDTIPPGATVVPAAAASGTGAVEFTVAAAEPVTGLGAGDVELGGSATGCVVGGFSTSASGATFTASGCADGTVVATLAAGAMTDAAGNVGPSTAVTSAPVVMDTVAPTVTQPVAAVRTGTPLVGSSIPVTVTWSGADNAAGSGIGSYTLQRSLDGGTTWSTVASGVTTTSRTSTVPTTGSTRFRVIARDAAGNQVTSAASPARSGRLVQQSSSAVKYSTAWTLASSTSFSGGSARYTKTAGRSASYTFTGRSIAVVSTRATTRGKVKIYINGVLQATVDTYRSSTQYRSVVWQKTYTSTQTKTIKIVVSGTSGRPRVDLDAFVVVK